MNWNIVGPLVPAGAAPTAHGGTAGTAAIPRAGPPELSRGLAAAREWTARHAEAVTVTAVLLVALAHLLRVYNRGLNLLDEGFVLHVAERVLQGQVPYRDFFTQLTPGAFMALAAVFAVTGPSVIVGRWITVLLGLVITALLYAGGRHLVSRPVAALAALAFPVWGIAQGWFYPNYSWFALAAAMGALVCVLRALGVTRHVGSEGAKGEGRRTKRDVHSAHFSALADGPKARQRPLRTSWRRIGEGSFFALRLSPFAFRRWLWLAAAGLLCGVAAFAKQNVGLYVLVALVAAILVAAPGGWRRRVAGATVLTLASTPVPLALIAWLAANGALAAFVRDAVWIPLAVFPQEMAAPYPDFWPPWPVASDPPGQGAWTFRLICLLPPLPYALGVVRLFAGTLRRRCRAGYAGHPGIAGAVPEESAVTGRLARSPFDRRGANGPLNRPGETNETRAAFAVWFAFGLAIWATAFPRADFDHVQVALGPAFVAGAALLEAAGGLAVQYRPKLPQALACAVLGAFLVAGLGNARLLHMGPGWTLRTIEGVSPRAAGILLDHDEAAELRRLIAEMRRLSAPGEAIAALPWNAGLYFLAERRNATRFDLFIPASVLPDDLPEVEDSLESAKLVVYWTARDTFVNNTSLEDRMPALHEHVMTRYRAVAAVNAYRLLVRE